MLSLPEGVHAYIITYHLHTYMQVDTCMYYLILSCTILCYLVLSYTILYYLKLSYTILYYLILSYTSTCIHTYMHACIHTYTHTYTHTYIYIYIHTLMSYVFVYHFIMWCHPCLGCRCRGATQVSPRWAAQHWWAIAPWWSFCWRHRGGSRTWV